MTGSDLLDTEHLPRDWHEKYRERLIRAWADMRWNGYPADHGARTICGVHYTHYAIDERGLEPSVLGDVDLRWAYQFYNKTAVMYVLHEKESGPPVGTRRFPEESPWIRNLYGIWARGCGSLARQDARFLLAMHTLVLEKSHTLLNCLDMETEGARPLESDIQLLIARHIRHCEILAARAKGPLSKKDYDQVVDYIGGGPGGVAYAENSARKAKAKHSSMAPTSKAVFLIATSDRETLRVDPPEFRAFRAKASNKNVLLVLTGHNEEMISYPPTFDDIPPAEIIFWRTNNIIEVSLETAAPFLIQLERREEAVNVGYRACNEGGRQVMYRQMVEKAEDAIDYSYQLNTPAGKDPVPIDNRHFFYQHLTRLKWSWEVVFRDEYLFHTLLSTRRLREKWNLGVA